MPPAVEKRILIPAEARARGDLDTVLRKDGWQPLPYKDADEALQILSLAPVTAIVVHSNGTASGSGLAKALRGHCPDAFVVSVGESVDGADAVLGEKCTARELAAAVHVGAAIRNARATERFLREQLRTVEHESQLQAERIKELEATCSTLQEWAKSAQELAVHDELTGIYNRRYFLQAADAELERARRDNSRFAIAMLDIDRFKQFNDTYGHVAGDETLKQFVRVLVRNLRRMDTVARYGGEEFILLLPETHEAGGALFEPTRLVDRLRQGIESDPSLRGSRHGIPLTVSAGIVQFPVDGQSITDLILEADSRLFRAKEGGRNRVVAS